MKKNIALLCGRGGSQSLRHKNFHPVLGKPLMVYPIEAARAARCIDGIYLSTDCPEMKTIARQHGVQVIDRPAELASPTAQHVDTLIHALEVLRGQGIEVDLLAVLMCNVGIFRKGLVDECIGKLVEDPQADSCVTGYVENDHHPYRVKCLRPDGYLGNWLDLSDTFVSTNRQDLPPCHILAHSLWVLRVERCFPPRGQKPWTFMGQNIVFVNNEGCRDVHSLEDIQYTEEYLRRAA